MSDTIDFQQGNDSGEVDSESISPYKDGESATETVFNRPLESLRSRTETLRVSINESKWVQDADRSLIHWTDNDATIQWDGSHIVLEGGSLYIASVLGPGESRDDDDLEGHGSTFPSRMAHGYLDFGTAEVQVISKLYQFEGGNEISVEVKGDEDLETLVKVDVEGHDVEDSSVQPGRDNVVVTYDASDPPSIQSVISAINNDVVANEIISVQLDSGDSSASVTDVEEIQLSGGLDGVFHQIPSGAVQGAPALQEGDCLAIWYESVKLRRESLEENSNHLLESSNLVNLSESPEKVANAVPLGRVLNGDFVWFSGFSMKEGYEYHDLGSNTAQQTTLESANFTTLTAEEVQSLSEQIDSQLGDHDTQLSNHDTQLGDHDTQLSNHDTQLGDHDTQLSNHDTELIDQLSFIENHVHDGGSGEFSVDQVNVEDLYFETGVINEVEVVNPDPDPDDPESFSIKWDLTHPDGLYLELDRFRSSTAFFGAQLATPLVLATEAKVNQLSHFGGGEIDVEDDIAVGPGNDLRNRMVPKCIGVVRWVDDGEDGEEPVMESQDSSGDYFVDVVMENESQAPDGVLLRNTFNTFSEGDILSVSVTSLGHDTVTHPTVTWSEFTSEPGFEIEVRTHITSTNQAKDDFTFQIYGKNK